MTEANGQPVQAASPELRLLLAAARPVGSGGWEGTFDRLLGTGVDWDRLVRTAEQHFLDVLLRGHLRRSHWAKVPTPIRAFLDRGHRTMALRALAIERAQRAITRDVLEPLGCRYLVVKGRRLALDYYGDAVSRQYRDLDLLVDPRDQFRVAQRMVDAGWRVLNKDWVQFEPKDLASFARFASVVEFASPEGVIVELHRRLDGSGCVFDTRQLISLAERSLSGDLRLPTAVHFVYAMYHHARHRWQSAHWLADLAAFTCAVDFSEAEMMSVAARHGLAATCREALRLRDDVELIARDGAIPPAGACSRFLADALESIERTLSDPAVRVVTSGASPEPDFPYPWQKSAGYRLRFMLGRLRPNENDYALLPLPARWHFLYYPLRPFRAIAAKFLRLA